MTCTSLIWHLAYCMLLCVGGVGRLCVLVSSATPAMAAEERAGRQRAHHALICDTDINQVEPALMAQLHHCQLELKVQHRRWIHVSQASDRDVPAESIGNNCNKQPGSQF